MLFRPASGGRVEIAEALTKVWMQIAQNNQLPWVRSAVFDDGIIRSRGFYDVRLDFDDNMQGEVRITPLNSKNVVVDPDAEEYDPDYWNDVFSDHDLRTKYKERMEKALERLPAVRASIPESWWWVGQGVPANLSWERIFECLERCRREDFWDLP